jgi:hypothetical protein
VEHADKVAALVGSLKVGDPCPVCGDPLESIPASPGEGRRGARRREERARRAGGPPRPWRPPSAR